jgi:hypothetical protein
MHEAPGNVGMAPLCPLCCHICIYPTHLSTRCVEHGTLSCNRHREFPQIEHTALGAAIVEPLESQHGIYQALPTRTIAPLTRVMHAVHRISGSTVAQVRLAWGFSLCK